MYVTDSALKIFDMSPQQKNKVMEYFYKALNRDDNRYCNNSDGKSWTQPVGVIWLPLIKPRRFLKSGPSSYLLLPTQWTTFANMHFVGFLLYIHFEHHLPEIQQCTIISIILLPVRSMKVGVKKYEQNYYGPHVCLGSTYTCRYPERYCND